MLLHANDFGCVPDGRFLERASIAENSALLRDGDGRLRPEDVGKHVAIPGAADLVTTIARLVDRREVRNARMDAGGRQLTGTLFDPELPAGRDELAFVARLHEGQRITVAGAGPGGSTLVTDIVKVVNATTIELAAAAATSVAGTAVILNRADRVALGDYARNSAANLTVDLGDRTVGDGEVTVGGRGLTSAGASFSALDLGKQVTLRAAGLHVTTIAAFADNNEVTLAAPAQREVKDGQADIWKSDSRPGLEQLLARLASLEVAAAEIVFDAGVYDFTRIPAQANAMNAAIGLRDIQNLTLRGAGAGATILRLMPQQDPGGHDTHVIETQDCRNLAIRALSVHGAYLTLAGTNEQMHGIFLNEGSQEVVVERVRVFQTAGDGIRFLGRGENPELNRRANKVRRVWVDGCQIVQNKRSGIAFQRAVEFVWIRDCYIEMTPPSTDSCIDFEPTGFIAGRRAAPSDIIIDANIIVHGTRGTAVSISGIAGQDPARRVKFTNNLLLGGTIFCTDVEQLSLQDNLVRMDEAPENRIPIHVQRGGDALVITGNLLVNDNPASEAVIILSEVNQRQVTRALVANNLCFARQGGGIHCISSDDVTIEGNQIIATGSCRRGILVTAQSSSMDNIAVRANDILAAGGGEWETGIQVNAANPVHHVTVFGNTVSGAAAGIGFGGTEFRQTPFCALNRIAANVGLPLSGLRSLPERAIVTGGAASRGGATPGSGAGRSLAGLGDPDNKVIGNVGDLFQRLDGQGGATLYVKETGDGTAAGWHALS